jgi:hypothetical protein
LLAGERYVGLDGEDGAGLIEAMVASASPSSTGDLCGDGSTNVCAIERVDLSHKQVVAKKAYPLSMQSVVAARNDPVGKAVVVGYVSNYLYGTTGPTYRVALLPF